MYKKLPDMNKQAIYDMILAELQEQLHDAKCAAHSAREAATHEESKAENQYDTLGLEAAYLAEGQSRRVDEYKTNIDLFKRNEMVLCREFYADTPIALGALVTLTNFQLPFFISPVAGGLEVSSEHLSLQILSQNTPLGIAIMGTFQGDTIEFADKALRIERVY